MQKETRLLHQGTRTLKFQFLRRPAVVCDLTVARTQPQLSTNELSTFRVSGQLRNEHWAGIGMRYSNVRTTMLDSGISGSHSR